MKITKLTPKMRARIVASLRDQRLDVHLGTKSLADYHRTVDEAAQRFLDEGVEPMPADVMTWGR